MNRLGYFINKLWVLLTTIHPISYLILFIVSGVIYFAIRRLIFHYRSQTKNTTAISIALMLLIALPVVALLLFIIVSLLLNNQPF